MACIMFCLRYQAQEVRPRLPDVLILPVCHELTYRTSNIGERMMPGVEYDLLVHLMAVHIASKRVVKGKRIVNFVPSVVAKGRQLSCSRSLEEASAASGGLRIDQEFMDSLIGRITCQAASVVRSLLGDGSGSHQVLPARHDRNCESREGHNQSQ